MGLAKRKIRQGLILSATVSTLLLPIPPTSAQEFKERATFKANAPMTGVMALSPDGKIIASACTDKTIRFLDAASGKETKIIGDQAGLATALAFSPDGKTLACGDSKGHVNLWNVPSGKNIVAFAGHHWIVEAVAFSPDGKTLASCDDESTMKWWDLATKTNTLTKSADRRTMGLPSLAYSLDGRTIASVNPGKTITFWETATAKIRNVLRCKTWQLAAFSPDGKTFASAGGSIVLVDFLSGEERAILGGHDGYATSLAFSPNGKVLASGGDDGTIFLWYAASGLPIANLRGHGNKIRSMAFSSDGTTLFSCSYNGAIKLWDNPVPKLETEVKHLIKVLGGESKEAVSTASKRLVELGAVAMPALEATGTTGDVKARERALKIVQQIMAIHPPTVKIKSQPVIVNDMELTLVAEKQWTLPRRGQRISIDVRLMVKNLSDQPRQLRLLAAVKVSLTDSKGTKIRGNGGSDHRSLARPVSEPIWKNQSLPIFLNSSMYWLNDKIIFTCTDAFNDSWQFGEIAPGTYNLAITYENKDTAFNDPSFRFDPAYGIPLWTGRAKTAIEVTVAK